MKFTVRADRQLIRAGARSRRFLCAEIQAPEAREPAGPASRQPRVRPRPVGLDGRGQDRARSGGGPAGHPLPAGRGPLLRGRVRRPHPGRRPDDARHRRGARGGLARCGRHRPAGPDRPRGRLAAGLRAGRRAPLGRGGGALPPPDRRPGERGRDGPRRDRAAVHRVARPARGHEHVRCGRPLRRDAPAPDGGRRWRELRVHRVRGADRGLHGERGGRGALDHRPGGRAGGRGGGGRSRRIPQRLPVSAGRERVAGRDGLALRRAVAQPRSPGHAAGGRGRCRARRDRPPRGRRRRARAADGRGPVHRGQPPGQRPPAPRPDGGPPRGGPVRGSRRARRAREEPRARFRGRAQGPRALHRAHPALRRRRPGDPGRGREPRGEGRSLRRGHGWVHSQDASLFQQPQPEGAPPGEGALCAVVHPRG